MKNQPANTRVLVRAGARTLTPEEIARISGAQSQTFAFTHIIDPIRCVISLDAWPMLSFVSRAMQSTVL